MKLHARITLLVVLLILLPSLPAAYVTRHLVERSLNLGLSAEVDSALEAGVRQARRNYQDEREMLGNDAADWVDDRLGDGDGNGDAELLASWRDDSDTGRLAGARLLLVTSDGEEHLLQEPDGVDWSARASDDPPGPPPLLDTTVALAGGGRLEVRRPTDEAWRSDAQALATTLQILRGLQSERESLETSFWMPFVAIYGFALLVALAAAIWLGRGITGPVGGLLAATRAVAGGRRDVQVPVTSRDEVGLLSQHFNDMVRTLDAQSRQLVDLEKMAGWREMARALAHEVKNPLTPIQLTVGEIRERYSGDDAEYRALLNECTRIVIEEVESLRQVVARFREFSRPVEPRFVEADLNALVADVAALQRDLRVETDLAENLGACRLDPDRLRQVLMNLASNTRTATDGVGEAKLRLATRPADDHIVLVIEDNGPGVPAAERDRLFEPYRSGSAGGLGLGLALVKGIILAHRGTIRVEEGRWGGARFHIELPRRPEADHE